MSENLLPEEKARKKIDMLLKKAGWSIVPRDQYSPGVSAVAIEEGILKGNLEADYLLFLEGKAIGVLEAKKESVSLDDIVANQAENYTHKLLPMYHKGKTPGIATATRLYTTANGWTFFREAQTLCELGIRTMPTARRNCKKIPCIIS